MYIIFITFCFLLGSTLDTNINEPQTSHFPTRKRKRSNDSYETFHSFSTNDPKASNSLKINKPFDTKTNKTPHIVIDKKKIRIDFFNTLNAAGENISSCVCKLFAEINQQSYLNETEKYIDLHNLYFECCKIYNIDFTKNIFQFRKKHFEEFANKKQDIAKEEKSKWKHTFKKLDSFFLQLITYSCIEFFPTVNENLSKDEFFSILKVNHDSLTVWLQNVKKFIPELNSDYAVTKDLVHNISLFHSCLNIYAKQNHTKYKPGLFLKKIFENDKLDINFIKSAIDAREKFEEQLKKENQMSDEDIKTRSLDFFVKIILKYLNCDQSNNF